MSNLIRVAIGFTAGICATLLPRITAALASDGDLVAFTPSFVALALAFSAIVGVVTMFTEWGEEAKPREVFKAALLVPSILSGMFNAADGARTASAAVERERETVSAVQSAAGVPTVKPSTPTIEPSGTSSQLVDDTGIRLAFDVREPEFYVVLGPFASMSDAARQASGSPVREADGRYYVLLAGPMSKGKALPIAIGERERGRPAVLLDSSSLRAESGA